MSSLTSPLPGLPSYFTFLLCLLALSCFIFSLSYSFLSSFFYFFLCFFFIYSSFVLFYFILFYLFILFDSDISTYLLSCLLSSFLCSLFFLLFLSSSLFTYFIIIKNGDGGHRSHCPFHAKEMLYHLSYIPIQLYTTKSPTLSINEWIRNEYNKAYIEKSQESKKNRKKHREK